MIKSCKKPPVYFESTTGSFYSQYGGLPLKSCRVDLPVNQSGSGTPSPTNIRDFIPYTALDFTANSVMRTFAFGQNVYIGYLDILTGELVATHELKTIDENSGTIKAQSYPVFYVNDFFDIERDNSNNEYCNCYIKGEVQANVADVYDNNPDFSFTCGKAETNKKRIMIKDSRFNTLEAYNEWLTNNPVKVAVKLATPITIPLGGMEINTILGLNSLSSSVGNISAEYLKAGR